LRFAGSSAVFATLKSNIMPGKMRRRLRLQILQYGVPVPARLLQEVVRTAKGGSRGKGGSCGWGAHRERHAGAERPELVRQLHRQLPAVPLHACQQPSSSTNCEASLLRQSLTGAKEFAKINTSPGERLPVNSRCTAAARLTGRRLTRRQPTAVRKRLQFGDRYDGPNPELVRQ
jgi:hypothetical protein